MNRDKKPGILGRILKLNSPFWSRQIIIAGLIIVFSTLQVFEIDAFKGIIDAAVNGSREALFRNFLMLLVFTAGCGITGFLFSYRGIFLDYSSIIHIQELLVKKLMRVKSLYLDSFHSGDIVSRVNDSVFETQTGIYNQMRTTLRHIFTIVVTLTYLTVVNIRLLSFTLIFLVIIPVILNLLSKRLRTLHLSLQEKKGRKDSFVKDTLHSAELVKTCQLEKKFTTLYENAADDILTLKKKLFSIESLIENFQNIALIAGDFFIIGYSAILSGSSKITIGEVLAFLLLYEKLIDPFSSLINIWPQLQKSISGAFRFFEIFDMPEDKHTTYETAQRTTGISNKGLTLSQVSFGYNEKTEIIKEASFCVPPGQITGIYGPSGQGKTTLTKLLLRLYECDKGEITWNGQSISRIPLSLWRQMIAYVPQEPFLFSGTILENIAIGNLNASRPEIEKLCRILGIHSAITGKENGYDTILSSQSHEMSGGECQRLIIARALIRNPDLLILDEPSSHLDSETESWLRYLIYDILKEKSIIIISHRMSMLGQAARIYRFDKGVLTPAS